VKEGVAKEEAEITDESKPCVLSSKSGEGRRRGGYEEGRI
jgi:hypothetical protein